MLLNMTQEMGVIPQHFGNQNVLFVCLFVILMSQTFCTSLVLPFLKQSNPRVLYNECLKTYILSKFNLLLLDFF